MLVLRKRCAAGKPCVIVQLSLCFCEGRGWVVYLCTDSRWDQVHYPDQSADAILRPRTHVTSTDDVIPINDVTMANKRSREPVRNNRKTS